MVFDLSLTGSIGLLWRVLAQDVYQEHESLLLAMYDSPALEEISHRKQLLPRTSIQFPVQFYSNAVVGEGETSKSDRFLRASPIPMK